MPTGSRHDRVVPKYPEEIFAVGFTLDPPDLKEGQTITGAEATVDSGLTKGSVAYEGNQVSVVVSGGTAGKKYKVRLQCSTSVGFTFKSVITVVVLHD